MQIIASVYIQILPSCLTQKGGIKNRHALQGQGGLETQRKRATKTWSQITQRKSDPNVAGQTLTPNPDYIGWWWHCTSWQRGDDCALRVTGILHHACHQHFWKNLLFIHTPCVQFASAKQRNLKTLGVETKQPCMCFSFGFQTWYLPTILHLFWQGVPKTNLCNELAQPTDNSHDSDLWLPRKGISSVQHAFQPVTLKAQFHLLIALSIDRCWALLHFCSLPFVGQRISEVQLAVSKDWPGSGCSSPGRVWGREHHIWWARTWIE